MLMLSEAVIKQVVKIAGSIRHKTRHSIQHIFQYKIYHEVQHEEKYREIRHEVQNGKIRHKEQYRKMQPDGQHRDAQFKGKVPGKLGTALKINKITAVFIFTMVAIFMVPSWYGVPCRYQLPVSAASLEEAGPGFDTVSPKFNMSYIHYSDKSLYIKYVENTNGALNEVAPNYFNLSKKGTLIITSLIDKAFIDEMHRRGIKVVPYLSNDWDRTVGRFALSKRYELSDAIAAAIEKYNLDGVNVDIENLTEQDRERYVHFVRLLRSKISPEKTVAVSVAANPRGLTTGWYGSYDYEELAKYSDYLMVMAYDEHYAGGPPGPVASIDFVENSIKYAIERVPSEKIVLGIPFYGRMWRSNGGVSGLGISLRAVENLVANYDGKVSFKNSYISSRAIVTIKSSDKKPVVNGITLKAGTYTIWYENETSIKSKLSLVKKYNLKGSGSWSLGQETTGIWKYYNLWLNGYYYEDCEGHWAQNSIIHALNNGWMERKGMAGFAPDEPLTRAEAAAAIVRAFQLDRAEKVNNGNRSSIVFIDVPGDHWAKNEIEIAVQHRIITGKGNGMFSPDEPVTRQELSVMLDRAFAAERGMYLLASRGISLNAGDAGDGSNSGSNGNKGADPRYVDVNRETCSWSYDSIMRVSQLGVFDNLAGERFNPGGQVSRAEMTVLLCNILGK